MVSQPHPQLADHQTRFLLPPGATVLSSPRNARRFFMFSSDFLLQWGKGNVREFPRPMGKMLTQATKVKKVLSTNSEIPVSFSSLHDDVDFSSTVTRAAFEDASSDLLERVTGPIDRALEQAGMTLNDIQEVELIGGGARIPKASLEGGLCMCMNMCVCFFGGGGTFFFLRLLLYNSNGVL